MNVNDYYKHFVSSSRGRPVKVKIEPFINRTSCDECKKWVLHFGTKYLKEYDRCQNLCPVCGSTRLIDFSTRLVTITWRRWFRKHRRRVIEWSDGSWAIVELNKGLFGWVAIHNPVKEEREEEEKPDAGQSIWFMGTLRRCDRVTRKMFAEKALEKPNCIPMGYRDAIDRFSRTF